MEGFLFDVGLLGPCKSMLRSAKDVASLPRTLQSMPRSAKDLAKHAEDVAKYAKVGRRRCQACLRILSTHNKKDPFIYMKLGGTLLP